MVKLCLHLLIILNDSLAKKKKRAQNKQNKDEFDCIIYFNKIVIDTLIKL